MVVLKIIFFDIWVSLGDALTDFAQGIHLMTDNTLSRRPDSFKYGLVVLAVIWIPGFVAIIHMLAHHRWN